MIKVLNITPENTSMRRLFNGEFFHEQKYSFPSISFDPSEASRFNIDLFISTKVLPNIEIDCDVILMPVSLTDNFLEVVGLRLAYHLRFTTHVNQFKPIIFISDVKLTDVLQITELASIIYSNGCYFSDVNPESIDDILKNRILTEINKKSFDHFLRNTTLNPPANYISSHSVSNEWSITKWAEILNVNSEAISDLKEENKNLLYFKFLEKKFPPIPVKNTKFLCAGSGTVLLVDDEWDKGWSQVLEKFYSHSPSITFQTLKLTFKDQGSDEITKLTVEEIKKINPDLIILDLRLTDQDFGEIPTNSTTGYKILKEIKEFNPGFDVVIFSATNKLWSLMELQKIGANGFIFKESPENVIDDDYASKGLSKLKELTESSVKKYGNKSLWDKVQIAKSSNLAIDADFLRYSSSFMDIAWNLINSENRNYAFLTLFQIVETFANDRYSQNDTVLRSGVSTRVYDGHTSKLKLVQDFNNGPYLLIRDDIPSKHDPKALFKISAVCAFIFQKDNSYLKKIGVLVQLRNKVAHDGVKISGIKELSQLLDIINLMRSNAV